MNDALAVAHDVAIGKGKPAADLVHVDMRLDPVANARGAAKSVVTLAVVSMGGGRVLDDVP